MSYYISGSQSLTSNVKKKTKTKIRANECFATLRVMEKRFHFNFLCNIFCLPLSKVTLHIAVVHVANFALIRLCFTYALYVCIVDLLLAAILKAIVNIEIFSLLKMETILAIDDLDKTQHVDFRSSNINKF